MIKGTYANPTVGTTYKTKSGKTAYYVDSNAGLRYISVYDIKFEEAPSFLPSAKRIAYYGITEDNRLYQNENIYNESIGQLEMDWHDYTEPHTSIEDMLAFVIENN